MEILVRRVLANEDTTIGVCFIDGVEFCFMLEDEYREDKVPGETRIPQGRYEIRLRNEGGMTKRYAQKFGSKHKGMLWLQDVPGFEWIYIHIGNTDDHSSGCLLCGFGAEIKPFGKWRTTNSTDAYLMLSSLVYEAIEDGDQVWITIQDEDDHA